MATNRDVAAGLGLMLGSLELLPDVATLTLGDGITAAATGHEALGPRSEFASVSFRSLKREGSCQCSLASGDDTLVRPW